MVPIEWEAVDGRITVLSWAKMPRPYLKNNLKQKRLGLWLKW
jgi:hypothetical protein